jgi:hypothetical protein
MHSTGEGTYTVSEMNNQLRTILMKAIMSKECLELQLPADDMNSCDPCSTRFHFFSFCAYAGNMWVANCGSISNFIPPNEFESSKQRVIATMKNNDTSQIDDQWYETKLDNKTSYKFNAEFMQWIDRGS